MAYTSDPFARIKAAPLGNPGDIELYDSRLYGLYEIKGSSIFRKDNGKKRLHPNSNEYKEVMRAATDF